MENGTYQEVDIAIIGGGVAGCIAALALAGSYRIALIDKLAEPVERVGECLPPASRRILKKLGLLQGLEQTVRSAEQPRHLVNTGTQSYWGHERVQVVDHLRNPDGFGWHLDRPAFEAYLRETVLQRGVDCCWPAKLHTAHYENQRWYLTATGTNKVHPYSAKFVIDASGRQSHFAKKAGIQRQHFDKLIACWGILPDQEENKLSTISAGEQGWWYTAALPGNKRVLAFHTDADLVDRGGIKSSAQFIRLAHANPQMSGMMERNPGAVDYQGTVAANSTRLDQVCGRQWAALGDAAMSFDPLSSQGMFNAMAGAVQLAELMEAMGVMQDPGTIKMEQFQSAYSHQMAQVWQHYERHKHIFYGEERRWRDAVFWRRRQGENVIFNRE